MAQQTTFLTLTYLFEKFEFSIPPGTTANLNIDAGITTKPFPFKLSILERKQTN